MIYSFNFLPVEEIEYAKPIKENAQCDGSGSAWTLNPWDFKERGRGLRESRSEPREVQGIREENPSWVNIYKPALSYYDPKWFSGAVVWTNEPTKS